MYRNLILVAVLPVAALSCDMPYDDLGNTEQVLIQGAQIGAPAYIESACSMAIALPPDDEGMPRDPITCSCALVAKDTEDAIIVTSAQCVDENLEANTLNDITVTFGADVNGGSDFGVKAVELHRYFDPELSGVNELALVQLDGIPSEAPAELNERSLSMSDVGATLTLLGYGADSDDDTSMGAREFIDVMIRVVGERFVRAGTDTLTSCNGDGGGPGFIDDGSGGGVLATVTVLQLSCFDNVTRTRVDPYIDTFFYPYIDRFTGPCPKDGTCTTTGCRSPDPDCDDCLWGNVCKEDCPARDWDCPLGSFVGDACDADGDCENLGHCIPADDDASFTYCATPCDPAVSDACPSTMECRDNGNGNECTFLTPSPGSQGAQCAAATNCRSGICEDQICVNTCTSQADCSAEFSCGPSKVQPGTMVCLGESRTGGGGFCSIGGDPDDRTPLAMFLAAMLAAVFVMRRRGGRR